MPRAGRVADPAVRDRIKREFCRRVREAADDYYRQMAGLMPPPHALPTYPRTGVRTGDPSSPPSSG